MAKKPCFTPHRDMITLEGFKKFESEAYQLRFKERPELLKVIEWAAGNGDRSENGDYIYGKKRLRELDRRLRFLSERIEKGVVVNIEELDSDQVGFGATVTVVDEDDIEKTYTIVGVDEVEPTKGHISWQSPIGKALLKSKVGEWVSFQSPKGKRELELINLEYKSTR